MAHARGGSTPRQPARLLEKLQSLEARVIADRAEFVEHRADVERALQEVAQPRPLLSGRGAGAGGAGAAALEELEARVARASRLARDVHDQQAEYQLDADERLRLLEEAASDAGGRLRCLHREVEALRLEVASLPWQRTAGAGAAASAAPPPAEEPLQSACYSTGLNSTLLSNISSDSSGSVLEAASSMIVATTVQLGAGGLRGGKAAAAAGGVTSADGTKAGDCGGSCAARLTEAATLADAEFRVQLQARCDVALAQVSERYGELRAELEEAAAAAAAATAPAAQPDGPAADLDEIRSAMAKIHSRVSETNRVVERLGEELQTVVVELMQAPGAEERALPEEARQSLLRELRSELGAELALRIAPQRPPAVDAPPPDALGDEAPDPATRSFLELQRWIRDQKNGPRRVAARNAVGSSCSDSCGEFEERLDGTAASPESLGHSVLSGVAQARWLIGNLRAELAAELTSGGAAALLRQEVQSAVSSCLQQALSEERSRWEDKFFSLQAQVLGCLGQNVQTPRMIARRVAVDGARKPSL